MMPSKTTLPDTGPLNLGATSRSRSGRDGGGDFADALDTQMQKGSPGPDREGGAGARVDRPRQPAAAAGQARRTDAGESGNAKSADGEEPQETAESAAGSGVAAEQAQAGDSEAASDQAEAGEEPVPVMLPVDVLALETGKDLPLTPPTDLAALPEAANGEASDANAEFQLQAEVNPAATGTTLTPAVAPAATQPVERADLAALEAAVSVRSLDARNVREPALATTPASSENAANRPAMETTGESLLMAVRLGLGRQGGESAGGDRAAAAALLNAAPSAPAPASTTVAPAFGAVLASATPTYVAAAPTAAAGSVPVLDLGMPVGQTGWDQAAGERVLWMARQNVQEAHIQLNPRDMGPVEVRVSVQQDQASVAFTAQHPGARDALEAALPRLREMFAESGLNLVQSDVSHQSPERGHEGGGETGSGRARADGAADGEVVVSGSTAVQSNRGLVDYYA